MAVAPNNLMSLLGAHDVELALRAVGGDRRAYGELVRRHSAAIRGLVRRMGADAATADDVAQDAFLAAFEQIADFRGEGPFRAWVSRIAARLYVRRRRREGRLELMAEIEEPAPAFGGEGGRADRLDLDEALKSLSEAERLCVSLCYGTGLSHAEAAEVLNTPLGTVKSHVKRGLDKLKAKLAPDEERKAHG